MRRLVPLVPLVLVALLACSAPSSPVDARGVLGAAELPSGWRWTETPVFYDEATLYEYINGAARGVLVYDFAVLAHLEGEGPGGERLSVDVYDMGTPLGAFGYYSVGRCRGCAVRDWGVEGSFEDGVSLAWAERFYLRVETEGEEAEELGRDVMEQLLAAIPGERSAPVELDRLPRGQRVP